jgi:antitoxin MazE
MALKEGDQIEITATGAQTVKVERDLSRLRAIEELRALRRPAPPGFKFDREEANAR